MIVRLRVLSSELVLGTLVAVLSILTAFSGYQCSMADSDQAKYNIKGQQMLTDANAEYLTANQMIVYDYSMYDGWYTADDEEKSEYYRASFSEDLQASIAANEEDPFSDAYYEAVYQEPNAMFEEAGAFFKKAEEFGERGDALQLIMLISALGLAFSAWASLLKEDSAVRLVFSILSIGLLVYCVMLYLKVPVVAA